MDYGQLGTAGLSLALLLGAARSFELRDEDLASGERLWDLYERWRSHHRASHDLEEKRLRFNVFKANARHVNEVNKMGKPYKLRLNKFADMTNHEFIASYGGSKVSHYRTLKGERPVTGFAHGTARDVPTSVDWRAKGAVTAVKDQGHCGKNFNRELAWCQSLKLFHLG